MNFAEALMLFCAKWGQIRASYGQPVGAPERINGLMNMLLLEIADLEPGSQRVVREAIKSALDEETAVPREALN